LQNQKQLLIVDDQNTIQPRAVELGALFGDMRVIRSGVAPHERFVLKGQMRARPGSKVQSRESTEPFSAVTIPRAVEQVAAPSSQPTTSSESVGRGDAR